MTFTPLVNVEKLPKVSPEAGGFSHLFFFLYSMYMNEHAENGITISYRLRNILEINGRSLESADFSPAALGEIVTLIDTDLRDKMLEEEFFDRMYRPTTTRSLRPVVLIARLALEDQPYMALTRRALQSRNRHFTHPSILTEEAYPYWNSVALTNFQPQVHFVRSTDQISSGVWLGVSESYQPKPTEQ